MRNTAVSDELQIKSIHEYIGDKQNFGGVTCKQWMNICQRGIFINADYKERNAQVILKKTEILQSHDLP